MEIVAEIGSNHCGSLEVAKLHINAAAEAGASAVKFQLWTRPDRLDSRPEVQAVLKEAQLRFSWLKELRDNAHHQYLKFIVTPFDLHACEMLAGLVDMVKISAYDLTYDDLLQEARKLDVPIILSTAMSTWEEIRHAVDLVGYTNKVILLQGVAAYPAREEDYNLGVLLEHPYDNDDNPFGMMFDGWGVSDHTLGPVVPMIATALGACMIEKHFRLDRVTDSPDAPHSLNPASFKLMVDSIHLTERILGDGEKEGPLPCEMELFTTCRRTNAKPIRG